MGGTFSEQWYRVSDLRVALLPSVRVHRQVIREKTYYILTEPYTNRFFKISLEAYSFLARLTPRRTVNEIWNQVIDEEPEKAPGQEEVVQLLSQLHQESLLYAQSSPDGRGIFEREKLYRKREFWGKVKSFLFVRIPMWDPNNWLNKTSAFARMCISFPGAVIWSMVIALGLISVISESDAFYRQSQGMLSLDNLPWLYICIAGLKTIHELAHAFVCKRYGGDVHTLGVMFLVFIPLPYMDATSSWSFRERRKRIIVSSAGVIAELFIAALAGLIWSCTGTGLIHSLAFNIMVVGSISSILFNGNPLLRYDAYFILSDFLDIPNLSQKSTEQWHYLGERYLMGSDSAASPATDMRQAVWLTLYGALSTLYRLFVTFIIILVVLDKIFSVGLLLIITFVFMWIVKPLNKLIQYLMSLKVRQHRRRAVTVTMILMFAVFIFTGIMPFPYSIKAPGIVESIVHNPVTAPVSGFLNKIQVEPGQQVKAGDVLFELKNPDLEAELILTRELIRENNHILRRALWDSPADREPVEKQIRMLEERLENLEWQKNNLTVKSVSAGIWAASPLEYRLNTWFVRGEMLGHITGNDKFRFTAVVSQEQADELFGNIPKVAGLKMRGQADKSIEITGDTLKLIPFRKERLASAALGWAGGGGIATRSDDEEGRQAMESFFEVRAVLPLSVSEDPVRLMHGLSGKMRIALDSRPLLSQIYKKLLQLVQKRYGVML